MPPWNDPSQPYRDAYADDPSAPYHDPCARVPSCSYRDAYAHVPSDPYHVPCARVPSCSYHVHVSVVLPSQNNAPFQFFSYLHPNMNAREKPFP